MRNRIAKTALAAATVMAIALPAGAQARQGADDPAGHVRHAAHQTAATPAKAHTERHRHGRRHARRADDSAARRAAAHRADERGGARRGGADDGPNHR
jgi:hypothetical protein